MTTQEFPRRWEAVFARAQVRQSARGLGEAMGDKGPSRAARVIYGGNVEPETIDDAARALKTTRAEIQKLRGEPVTTPYRPPRAADELSEMQRRLVNEVIGELVSLNRKAQGLNSPDQGPSLDETQDSTRQAIRRTSTTARELGGIDEQVEGRGGQVG